MIPAREVRRAEARDMDALAEVFWRGVHEGAASHYSARERQAWLPERPTGQQIAARLDGQEVFVVEEAGCVVGMMSLTPSGYLDLAYVLPEVRGRGVADLLLLVLENHARVAGIEHLTTRASDAATGFFRRHGWEVRAAAPQVRDGVTLSATDMQRWLVPPLRKSA